MQSNRRKQATALRCEDIWLVASAFDWYQFAPKVGAFYKVRTTTGYLYVLVMRAVIAI